MSDAGSCQLSHQELDQLWQAVRNATAAVRRQLAAELQPEGLSESLFAALLCLAQVPDHRLPVTALASRVGMSNGAFTKVVDRLDDGGYIARDTCAVDRRIHYAVLTDEGRALVERLLPLYHGSLRRAFAEPLGAHRVRLLREMLGAVAAA